VAAIIMAIHRESEEIAMAKKVSMKSSARGENSIS